MTGVFGPRVLWIVYPVSVLAAIALFLLIRFWGEMLPVPAPSVPLLNDADPRPAITAQPLMRLLIALLSVIALGRLLAALRGVVSVHVRDWTRARVPRRPLQEGLRGAEPGCPATPISACRFGLTRLRGIPTVRGSCHDQ